MKKIDPSKVGEFRKLYNYLGEVRARVPKTQSESAETINMTVSLNDIKSIQQILKQAINEQEQFDQPD